jgi:hypothetical protein
MLALATATVFSQADEPKKPDPGKRDLTAEEKDRALEEVALAYQIADLGRKAGSPEALLGAAKLLSKLNGKDIGLVKLEGVKPVTGKPADKKKRKAGEPIQEEGGTPTNFLAEIKKLKEDARKLNRPKDETLAALIDKVKADEPRGSMQGPKWLGPYTLPPYGTEDKFLAFFTFKFRGGEPARIVVRNKSGAQLKLEACDIDEESQECGETQAVEGTSDLQLKWRPKATAKFSITVTNLSEDDAQFDIFKN